MQVYFIQRKFQAPGQRIFCKLAVEVSFRTLPDVFLCTGVYYSNYHSDLFCCLHTDIRDGRSSQEDLQGGVLYRGTEGRQLPPLSVHVVFIFKLFVQSTVLMYVTFTLFNAGRHVEQDHQKSLGYTSSVPWSEGTVQVHTSV